MAIALLVLPARAAAQPADQPLRELSVRARLLRTPTSIYGLSFSVSRALRTPSRVEHDFESGNLLSGPADIRPAAGNPAFDSEELIAYEVGLVATPHPKAFATGWRSRPRRT